jgi:thiamine pyrophosphate-dependent acetolactate synthase large subunit-like protein
VGDVAPHLLLHQRFDLVDPRALGRKLGAAIPKGALITCGAGHFFSWVASYMPMPEGSEIQFSYNFGAVGQGLGVMVGTAVGNPDRKHVAIEGDGSMMFNIQELETIVREKLDITLVVWNDGGYGAEVHKLTAKGFNEKLAQWESPDFVAVAKAFGGDGVKLDTVDQIGDAVKAGLAKGGLYLIDARVSATTPTDPYAKVYHGIPSMAPLLRQPA